MKLTKQLRYLVRIRDYETVQVEVGAEVTHHDYGFTDDAWAELASEHRKMTTEHLEILVIHEVEKLAREELAQINQWSEISPNLAEDFLSSVTLSPVTLSRSPNARNQKTAEAPKRTLTRTPPPTPPAA